jgi:hypothetical protein
MELLPTPGASAGGGGPAPVAAVPVAVRKKLKKVVVAKLPPRVFVATPCFDSPLTRNMSTERLNEYARLCAADAQLNFKESPLVARHMVAFLPRTIVPPSGNLLSSDEHKKWLSSWLQVSQKICLYTDLGVTPYLTEIIKFATANGIETEFRLLGEAWIQAREIPLEEPWSSPVPVETRTGSADSSSSDVDVDVDGDGDNDNDNDNDNDGDHDGDHDGDESKDENENEIDIDPNGHDELDSHEEDDVSVSASSSARRGGSRRRRRQTPIGEGGEGGGGGDGGDGAH